MVVDKTCVKAILEFHKDVNLVYILYIFLGYQFVQNKDLKVWLSDESFKKFLFTSFVC